MTRFESDGRSTRTELLEASLSEEPIGAPNGELRPPIREWRLRKVLEIIHSEPACSVSDLALEVHLSPTHLQRLFKQKTGRRVSDLIGEQRLQKAALLLSSSDLPIKEIAHSVGYEHHSSFVRAFHRRFAQSPKYYRQQNYGSHTDNFQFLEKAAAD